MGLEAQAPFGMCEAIVNGGAELVRGRGAFVHWLQQEMGEVEVFDLRGIKMALRIDELQFVARSLLLEQRRPWG